MVGLHTPGTTARPTTSHGRDAAGCDVRPRLFPRRLTELGMRVFSLGLVLGLLATLTGSRVLLAAGAFAGVLPWASMLTVPGQRIEVTAEGAGRARVGSPAPLRIRLRNTGRGTLPALEMRCVRPLFATDSGAIGPLPPRDSVVWDLDSAPLTRGVSTHLHVELAGADLFGLSLQRVTVLVPVRLVVAPRAVPVPGPMDRLRTGTALDPGDLRLWRPGDSPATVAWRASARRGAGPSSSLVVRDRAPSEPDIVRIGVAGGAIETTERVLEVLAAAALALLEQGRQVEIRIGEQVLRPARADVLLDALAALPRVPALPDGPHDLVITCRDGAAAQGGTCWIVDGSGRVGLP